MWYRFQLNTYIDRLNDEIIKTLQGVFLRFGDSKFVDTNPVMKLAMLQALDKLADSLSSQKARLMANQLASEFAKRVNQQNHAQTVASIKSVLGVDVSDFIMSNQFITAEIEIAMLENINLIVSVAEEHLLKVRQVIHHNILDGQRHSSVINAVSRAGQVSKSRAKVIARDQTNKFNGALTRVRQQSLGIEQYIWSTSGDERVRQEHRENNGKLFRWDSPPITGHPGQDIQCRCVAIPYFESD
ncbi:phage minor head protein [Thorsellia anophelis]|uniref:Phage putative head morphogenesis protein, SPP1 gp7 family n=1 Tax=Thorsellia anophelis DSM 18579 TaxID=1123402 RepID=A0A1I0CC93_9GAMM|nr:phage minor head protein [Thorsellia anophelis]SET17134.1 phage putative head morphogenesis protein, SPP1 gp7 family [Thorsellia anophelis DSM 18579]